MNELNFSRTMGAETLSEKGADVPLTTPWRQRPEGLFPMLGYYLAVARRRRWLIFGVLAAMIIVALIVTIMTTRMYTAHSTIEIRRESDNIVRVQGVEPETGLADMEFYQTQYSLLQSRTLAERVASDMRLFDNPHFFELYRVKAAKDWFSNGQVIPGASTREQRLRKATEILLSNISVSPIRMSRLVDIYYRSPDPQFSALVLNNWGQRFIRLTLERRFDATSYARQFLEQRLGQLRTRLDRSERQLVGYAAREGIVSIPGATGTADRSLAADDLASMNRELAQATSDRLRAQSRLNAPPGASTEALENQAITGLRQRRAQAGAEYARMLAQFEPDYPPAVALREELAQLDQAIGREETRVSSAIRNAYQSSRTREAALQTEVNGLKGDVIDMRRRSIQYNIYQREVDTNSQLYDALLQRYKEIGVAGGVGVNNISVVDRALAPDRPSSPRVLVNLVLALIVGTGLGFVLALVFDQMDESISEPSQVTNVLGIPLLGAIPKSKGDSPSNLLEDPKSDLAEAYIAVQTSLAFSSEQGTPPTIAVTSTRPGEGKSTTAYAIARALGRTGKSVLLLDGDMRSPSIHHLIGIENGAGLSNFLAGEDHLNEMIHRPQGLGISILSAGPQPPSAAELLSGDRLPTLLSLLRQSFDQIVIDTPPVMGLADAPLLASHVQGIVFVVESNDTKIGQARQALQRLLAAHGHLVGAVLTKFQARRTTYGYEYGYGYGRQVEDAA